MDLNNFLNRLDKETIDKLMNLASTQKGQQLINKLKSIDKDQLIKQISTSESKGISKESLKQMLNDPNVLARLTNLLNRE